MKNMLFKKKEKVMKNLNITLMAILMTGMGSNLFAVPTITNSSNQIVTVKFLDANKQLLKDVLANNEETIPGRLWYGGITMNIPENAELVVVKSNNTISSTIDPKKSYFIIGFDATYDGESNIPWAIIDADSYQKSSIKQILKEANKEHMKKVQEDGKKFDDQQKKLELERIKYGVFSLSIVDQQALDNKLYIYTCSPQASNLQSDFFVLTNSNSPTISDTTLGTMSARKATDSTNMLSLVSGILYNSSGKPIKDTSGTIYQINAKQLTENIHTHNAGGFSKDFSTTIVNACNNYKK